MYCLSFSLVLSFLALTASFTSAYLTRPTPVLKRGAGIDVPLSRSTRRSVRKRGAEIGLGDLDDLVYSIPIQIGSTLTTVQLDTGSSDLWVASDACNSATCPPLTAPVLKTATLNATGSFVVMPYGGGASQASGPVAIDTVTLAGITVQEQPFAAVNNTEIFTLKDGIPGIIGLGFPPISHVQIAVTGAGSGSTDGFIQGTYKSGPILSKITSALQEDVFAVSLQRATVDIESNDGLLTIGKLPDGVDNSSLTWVPVRRYTANEGGVRPPSFAPNEVYASFWEIDIDNVYLDGVLLRNSTIPTVGGVDGVRTSALIDSGNSFINGPSDVVNTILSTVIPEFNPSSSSTPTLPCTAAHSLVFEIGGKLFPVDPRDFISHNGFAQNNTQACTTVLTTEAPPAPGALMRWNLGDPFLKSTIAAFHYGNLTNPSVDPPRIGLLSRVPSNANALLTQAVAQAQNAHAFPTTTELAPTASAAAVALNAGITIAANGELISSSVAAAGSAPSSSGSPVGSGSSSSGSPVGSGSSSSGLPTNGAGSIRMLRSLDGYIALGSCIGSWGMVLATVAATFFT